MQIKHTLMTLWATLWTLVAILLIGGCSPDPQKDIALFQPFIDANIDKVSDDPYISSTLKPGDEFYDMLLSLQHGRPQDSRKWIMDLVEKGDAQAQYWFARRIYTSSIKTVPVALGLLKESAGQNNPYAFFSLSPKGDGCVMYFGKRNCSEDNFYKAVDIFKERAQQGDLRAQYFLLRMFKPDGSRIEHRAYFMYDFDYDNYYLDHSDETRELFINEIIRFAEGHYYQPLMDYIDYIIPVPKHGKPTKGITPAHYDLAIELLQTAANNNYLPAIHALVAIKKDELPKDHELYQKLYKLGGVLYLKSRGFWHSDEYTNQELYTFAYALELMTGDTILYSTYDYTPTEEEKLRLQKKAKQLLDGMTPMVYIDEFTGRNNWVDR